MDDHLFLLMYEKLVYIETNKETYHFIFRKLID